MIGLDKKKQGKQNRAAGKRFELKVREDLESKGWIVFRNSNDVEFQSLSIDMKSDCYLVKTENAIEHLVKVGYSPRAIYINHKEAIFGKFKQAKSKWNPFTKMPMTIQSGFPDFVCVDKGASSDKVMGLKCLLTHKKELLYEQGWGVIFIECKSNGQLSKIEKEKINWIKDNLHIDVFVASKGDKRGKIKYENK